VIIALAQLMVVLDATIVNIALPSAQRDLGMSDGNRQWVITAYTLAFGGLLLLGGRIADLVGRKRTFIIGLIGFAGASALGGAATTSGMLFGARALQGVFAAVLAPSALSLLTTTFTDPKERGKAFGIYGALAGSGSAIGFIAGGLLTEYLNWRWCLYVNIPIAIIASSAPFALLHDRPGHTGARLDVPGVLLGCGGLVAIVYGFSEAEPRGWTDSLVLGLFAAGVVLLTTFVWWQTRAPSPLLPLHIVKDRNRAGCFLTMGLATIGMFGMFLFMTYYLQVILDYSPVKTGLAFLPLTVAIIIGSTQISARLMHHVPPRTLMVPGAILAAAGMSFFTRLTVDSDYTTELLPACC
jgi:EmrB/QacA subfamily drug resistance transporter